MLNTLLIAPFPINYVLPSNQQFILQEGQWPDNNKFAEKKHNFTSMQYLIKKKIVRSNNIN